MEEVQSFWEIPTISHFCHVFRAAFNLFYFEIKELEEAILNPDKEHEDHFSIELLVVRLLQGCCKEKTVTTENWELHLQELFESRFEKETNPVSNNQTPFWFLPVYSKVNILFKLCELRLDVNDVPEAIKDISWESMQAKCVGKDNAKNVYWYFCGIRLYKENTTKRPQLQQRKKGAPLQNSKHKVKNEVKGKSGLNGNIVKWRSSREKKAKVSPDIDPSWSIACHTLDDWKTFVKSFSKSRSAVEKQLVQEIEAKYLPILPDIIAETEQFLKKRVVELAPKRTSSRICKVQAQERLQKQMVAEAKEEAKQKRAVNEVYQEIIRKQKEIKDRGKRAAERHKAMEERAKRAKFRQKNSFNDEDSQSANHSGKLSYCKNLGTVYQNGTTPSKANYNLSRSCQNKNNGNHSGLYIKSDAYNQYEIGDKGGYNSDDNRESESDVMSADEISATGDDEASVDNDIDSDARSSGESDENEVVDDEKELVNESSSDSECVSDGSSSEKGSITETVFPYCHKNDVLKNSHCVPKWNTKFNSKGQSIHVVNSSCNDLSSKTRLRQKSTKDYRNKAFGGCESVVCKENRNVLQPLTIPYVKLHSFNTKTTTPSIIRFDFIKKSDHNMSS